MKRKKLIKIFLIYRQADFRNSILISSASTANLMKQRTNKKQTKAHIDSPILARREWALHGENSKKIPYEIL